MPSIIDIPFEYDRNPDTNDVDEKIIQNSEYLFLEGYLVASPKGYDSFKKAIELARQYSTKVAITLSDAFIVNTFEKELKELISMKCDLIFCNEIEKALKVADLL